MNSNNFILLAEDDADDQELMRLAFAQVSAGHQFEVVNNGKQLLESLFSKGRLPCLIILDLNMPVLNGIQTLSALEKEPRFQSVPKVVFTTSENDDNKKKSFSHGAAAYFVKPSSMKDFVAAAQKMLTYCA